MNHTNRTKFTNWVFLLLTILFVPNLNLCADESKPDILTIGNAAKIRMDFSGGGITGLTLQTADMHAAGAGFSIRDVMNNQSEQVTGQYTSNGNESVRFSGLAPTLGIALTAVFTARNEAIYADVQINDKQKSDRAIDVTFTIKISGHSWKFCNLWVDNPTHTEAVPSGGGANQIDNLFGGLQISQIPFGACIGTQKIGVMLAHSMREPRCNAYRFSASSPETGSLSITTALGLAAETKIPHHADYSFVITGFKEDEAINAEGSRAAMTEYYRIFPECFEHNLTDYPGAWAIWISRENLNLAKQAGMGTNQIESEGLAVSNSASFNSFVIDNAKAGLRALFYSEPWGIWHPFEPGWLDSHITNETGVNAFCSSVNTDDVKKYLQGDANDITHTADRFPGGLKRKDIVQIIDNTVIERKPGIWGIQSGIYNGFPWSVNEDRKNYQGTIIFTNSDPDLPEPNRWTLTWGEKTQNGLIAKTLDDGNITVPAGVYLDSEVYGLGWHLFNYRRSHWTYADVPLAYEKGSDGVVRPALPMLLSNSEFLRKNQDEAHRRNWCVASNTWHPLVQFIVGFTDMVGAGEHAENTFQSQTAYRTFRFLSYRKPVSVMDYVLDFHEFPVNQETVNNIFEPRCNYYLLYGIYPGTANQWNNSEKINALLALLEKYGNLTRAINVAGWQPFTAAAVEGSMAEQLLVERWGNNINNGVYFTVRAKDKDISGNAVLSANMSVLNPNNAELTVEELVDNSNVITETSQDGRLRLSFNIPANRTLLFKISKK